MRPSLSTRRSLARRLAGLLVAAACLPGQAAPALPAQDWIGAFAQALQDAPAATGRNTAGPVRFVAGNDIWQPGRQFRSGPGWLGLVCDAAGCVLVPATLRVRSEAWHGHYDERATAGQHLTFRLAGRARPRAGAVAWFRVPGAPAWLRPGSVATYYSGTGRPAETGQGTLEARVDLPGGAVATFVPMVLSAKLAPDLWARFDADGRRGAGTAYLLQLRAQGRRQLLLGELGTCSQAVGSDASYLLWAGDLDRDGKPDYLVSFVDAAGQVQLYLSSLARTGQIVGLAGIHEAPPYGGECDGEGWGM